jgi:hypothetical protein
MRGVGVALLVAFAGGCGASVGSGMSAEFATSPGNRVLTPAVRKVTLTSKGGGLGGAGPWSYTLSLDTKRLAFTGSTLEGEPPMPVPTVDDVSLADQEFSTVTAAAGAVTVSARRDCGADAPTRELRLESSDASLTYGDDFYGCLMDYVDYVKFDALDSLQTAFEAVAP